MHQQGNAPNCLNSGTSNKRGVRPVSRMPMTSCAILRMTSARSR